VTGAHDGPIHMHMQGQMHVRSSIASAIAKAGRAPVSRGKMMAMSRVHLTKRSRGPEAVHAGRWMARREEPFAVFVFGILKYALC
jgi:hypothetical protein